LKRTNKLVVACSELPRAAHSGFRLTAPASLTPSKRLNFSHSAISPTQGWDSLIIQAGTDSDCQGPVNGSLYQERALCRLGRDRRE